MGHVKAVYHDSLMFFAKPLIWQPRMVLNIMSHPVVCVTDAVTGKWGANLKKKETANAIQLQQSILALHQKRSKILSTLAWSHKNISTYDCRRTIYSHLFTLTHWGRDKMVVISQMTLLNAFSWMEMLQFRLNFTEVCSNNQYSSIGSDNGLAPTRRQAIIWANDG